MLPGNYLTNGSKFSGSSMYRGIFLIFKRIKFTNFYFSCSRMKVYRVRQIGVLFEHSALETEIHQLESRYCQYFSLLVLILKSSALDWALQVRVNSLTVLIFCSK